MALKSITETVAGQTDLGRELRGVYFMEDGSLTAIWRVQQPDGSWEDRSARCGPDVESDFAANANLTPWVEKIAADTLPKVT
jgi:hypothetical protein